MNSIADDCFVRLGLYLDFIDLAKFSGTSKKFNFVCDRYKLWYTCHGDFDTVVRAIVGRGKPVRNMYIIDEDSAPIKVITGKVPDLRQIRIEKKITGDAETHAVELLDSLRGKTMLKRSMKEIYRHVKFIKSELLKNDVFYILDRVVKCFTRPTTSQTYGGVCRFVRMASYVNRAWDFIVNFCMRLNTEIQKTPTSEVAKFIRHVATISKCVEAVSFSPIDCVNVCMVTHQKLQQLSYFVKLNVIRKRLIRHRRVLTNSTKFIRL